MLNNNVILAARNCNYPSDSHCRSMFAQSEFYYFFAALYIACQMHLTKQN